MTTNPHRTRTDFLALTISASEGRRETDERGHDRYRFTVTVQSDATGARIRFTYHGSNNDHDRGVSMLDREGLLFAFWSFTSDAAGADETFAEWASSYGYDLDSYSARRTYAACRSELARFGRLWHDADRFSPGYVLEQLAAEGIE